MKLFQFLSHLIREKMNKENIMVSMVQTALWERTISVIVPF